MKIRNKIKEYVRTPLTHELVRESLVGYERPNDKISELIKKGYLVSLRKGLYVPGPEMDLAQPNLFLIANHLRGPSYVSLETAMSHWFMIPERVHEISSITLKTTHSYHTPIAHFSYRRLSAPYYSFGINRVKVGTEQFALVASPEKALCDKIIVTSGVNLRSKIQTMDFLTQDLRIEEETLFNLDLSAIESWLEDAPKRTSLEMLIKTIQTL